MILEAVMKLAVLHKFCVTFIIIIIIIIIIIKQYYPFVVSLGAAAVTGCPRGCWLPCDRTAVFRETIKGTSCI